MLLILEYLHLFYLMIFDIVQSKIDALIAQVLISITEVGFLYIRLITCYTCSLEAAQFGRLQLFTKCIMLKENCFDLRKGYTIRCNLDSH